MPISYHEMGTLQDMIVSRTALDKLDPELGGSPQAFLNYFKGDQKKITPSMEVGDLFATWLENESKFVVAELDKPTEQFSNLVDKFYPLYFNKEYEKDQRFADFAKVPINIDLDATFKVNEIFSTFTGQKPSDFDFQLLSRCIFYARKEAQVDKRLKDNTILEKFQTLCIPYLNFLKNAGDRIILDKSTKEILSNCQESLKSHKIANDLINQEGHKREVEILWTITEPTYSVEIKRKAKLDNLHIDWNTHTVTIIDNKTTSKPVSQFKELMFNKYKLGRQLVSYYKAVLEVEGILKRPDFMNWKVNLINIVTQTTEPFTTQVYKMSPITIGLAQVDLANITRRLAFHISKDNWDLSMEELTNGYVEI